MIENIIVVCIGNICRSPMAEVLLKQALSKKSSHSQIVSSAGLAAVVGHPAEKFACELMLEKGIDISNHIATQINQTMIRKADLILVMEEGHKNLIEKKQASTKGKVFRLGEWDGYDIPDPYKKDRKAFENALQLIEQGVSQWLYKI